MGWGGLKSQRDLFVSVFKEASVGVPGNYLDHFKRNGKCLKTQSEKCPRQPSAWLGRMDEAGNTECAEWGREPVVGQRRAHSGPGAPAWRRAPGGGGSLGPAAGGGSPSNLQVRTPRWSNCVRTSSPGASWTEFRSLSGGAGRSDRAGWPGCGMAPTWDFQGTLVSFEQHSKHLLVRSL